MATSVLPTPSVLPSPRRAPLCGPRGRRAMQTATQVCRVLRRRGWSTSLTGFRVAGDTDVRLLAVSPHSAVAVELLCPCPDVPDDAGPWVAVRVQEEERVVWRGPDRNCAAGTLAHFIDDLLRRPDEVLAQRYQLCG